MSRSISANTQALIDMLPVYERDAPEIVGTINALSNEVDRLDAAVATVVNNIFPQSALELLGIFERMLGLGVNPPDKTLAQRRASVVAFLQAISSSGSGLSWETTITRLIGTSWSYTESPSTYSLTILVPFAAPLSPPTQSAPVASSGGSLPAGTYYYDVTATNTYGETPSSSEPSVTTTGAGSKVALSWSAVTSATGYDVYRGTGPAGSAGAPVLIAQLPAGSTSYSDTGGAPIDTGKHVPTANSTRSPLAQEFQTLVRQITPAHLAITVGYQQGFLLDVSRIGYEPL